MKSNIALIGMSGTFKSTVAKKLAPLLKKMSLDCDELIEFENAMSITEIFEKAGEKYFRELEKKQIFNISDFNDTVIATGGGAVLDEQNMQVLKSCSYVICLDADAKSVYSRIKKDLNRPLFKNMTLQTVEKYVEERRPLYRKWADFTVNTVNKSSDKVTQLIYDWYAKQK